MLIINSSLKERKIVGSDQPSFFHFFLKIILSAKVKAASDSSHSRKLIRIDRRHLSRHKSTRRNSRNCQICVSNRCYQSQSENYFFHESVAIQKKHQPQLKLTEFCLDRNV